MNLIAGAFQACLDPKLPTPITCTFGLLMTYQLTTPSSPSVRMLLLAARQELPRFVALLTLAVTRGYQVDQWGR